MYVVAITMLGKYRVDATFNPQNQIQRIKTTVNENAMGDFNIEHESTNQQSFGNVKWPTAWHSHQGWDDNWQFFNLSTGHNAYGGNFPNVQPNVCTDPVPVPESVRTATFPNTVTVEKMGNGIYMLGGGPANSYMVEFRDWVAVFEAPGSEERSLAVIDQITKLAPNKPIRWLISSHAHFDHIGGLRTYDHIGATIIDAQEQHQLPEPRCAGPRRQKRQARSRLAVPADRTGGGLTTTRPFRRTSSSPTTAGSCTSTTCSR